MTNCRIGTVFQCPSVKDLKLRIAVEAVPSLRRMEERVGVPDVRPREPDDPGEHPGTGMRGKADDEVPDQVLSRGDPVEGGETGSTGSGARR